MIKKVKKLAYLISNKYKNVNDNIFYITIPNDNIYDITLTNDNIYDI